MPTRTWRNVTLCCKKFPTKTSRSSSRRASFGLQVSGRWDASKERPSRGRFVQSPRECPAKCRNFFPNQFLSGAMLEAHPRSLHSIGSRRSDLNSPAFGVLRQLYFGWRDAMRLPHSGLSAPFLMEPDLQTWHGLCVSQRVSSLSGRGRSLKPCKQRPADMKWLLENCAGFDATGCRQVNCSAFDVPGTALRNSCWLVVKQMGYHCSEAQNSKHQTLTAVASRRRNKLQSPITNKTGFPRVAFP